jgi:DNA polymerase
LKSFQNLVLLQNLYRLKALGFSYVDSFNINTVNNFTKPNNLDELCKDISTCHLCDLSKSRSQSMYGYGNIDADLMVVDYSVSLSEDSQNNYYVGKSGETLKKMIENVLELKTSDVYFTHQIKCKPLNSNTPSASEWESCKPYLWAQIEFIKPKVIVTLGKSAYENLTGENENFESVRGHVIDYKSYKLVPIYHPQYLLRNPEYKKITMSDLKTIKRCL